MKNKTTSFREAYGHQVIVLIVTIFMVAFTCFAIIGMLIISGALFFIPGEKFFITCGCIMLALIGLFLFASIVFGIINIVAYIKAWRRIFFLPLSYEDLKAQHIDNLSRYMIYLRNHLSCLQWYGFKRDYIIYVKLPSAISKKIEKAINENFDSSHLANPSWSFVSRGYRVRPLTIYEDANLTNDATYRFGCDETLLNDKHAPKLISPLEKQQ